MLYEQIYKREKQSNILVLISEIMMFLILLLFWQAAYSGQDDYDKLVKAGKISAFCLFNENFLLWFLAAYFIWNVILIIISYRIESKSVSDIMKENNAVPYTNIYNRYREINEIISELKIATGFHSPIKLYIIPDESINAFATGSITDSNETRRKFNSELKAAKKTGENINSDLISDMYKECGIAITVGAIEKLSKAEMTAVLGHEMSHLVNHDIHVESTLTSCIISLNFAYYLCTVLGLVGLNNIFKRHDLLWWLYWILAFMIFPAIILYMAKQIITVLFFALSRQREYLADANSVKYTSTKSDLISVFNKLQKQANSVSILDKISNKLDRLSKSDKISSINYNRYYFATDSIFSTHPSLKNRIKRLNEM